MVAPVVDRAVVPAPTGRGERSIPCRPRRGTRPPGARPIAPRCPAEVTALGVAVPRATGVRIRSTESVGATGVITGSAGSARATWVIAGSAGAARVIAGPAGATWVIAGSAGAARVIAGSAGAARMIARSTGTTRSARTTRIVRTSGCVAATRRRPAVVPWRLWRSGSSVGKSGAHPQGCSAQRSGDGHPSDKLLQLHNASPIH
ncbi:hypothetical protein A5753_06995 [Mycobacterium sp. 852002-51971_SCH5477799-a]|nr:hypothetical protein A5753_06995 [Mycobacterium sp. 852002-51971_SCH5477799-a]